MIKLNNMQIGKRLNIVLNTTMLLIIGSLGIYLINIQKTDSFKDTNQRMISHVDDLESLILQQIQSNEEKVAIGINTAEQYMKTLGDIR